MGSERDEGTAEHGEATETLTALYQWSQGLTVVGPVSQSDGHDSPRLIDDAVPGFAGGIEDILVGVEGAV